MERMKGSGLRAEAVRTTGTHDAGSGSTPGVHTPEDIAVTQLSSMHDETAVNVLGGCDQSRPFHVHRRRLV